MLKRLLNLMKEKNHFLEKFMMMNEREIVHFQSRRFDRLENFYSDREKILEILRYLDGEVEKCQVQVDVAVLTSEDRAELGALMQIKKEMVEQILRQDLDVLALIESEKSHIIRELQDLKQGKKVMKGYHHGVTARNLDEQA